MTLLLTIAEASAALKLSRAKIYELIARDELRSVKIHGSRRIRASDLEAFVAALEPQSDGAEQR